MGRTQPQILGCVVAMQASWAVIGTCNCPQELDVLELRNEMRTVPAGATYVVTLTSESVYMLLFAKPTSTF
jgi:hypothetical protein